jgi:hypothetical protein
LTAVVDLVEKKKFKGLAGQGFALLAGGVLMAENGVVGGRRAGVESGQDRPRHLFAPFPPFMEIRVKIVGHGRNLPEACQDVNKGPGNGANVFLRRCFL